MAKYFAQGRLGTELGNAPLYGLWMLVKYSPLDNPELTGETLDFIISRIATLEGSDIDGVAEQVKTILAEKEENRVAQHLDARMKRLLESGPCQQNTQVIVGKPMARPRPANRQMPVFGIMLVEQLESGDYTGWV